jgi:hypothetical protein
MNSERAYPFNPLHEAHSHVTSDIKHGHLDITDKDACDDWAREYADGHEVTIYTWRHRQAYADGVLDDYIEEAQELTQPGPNQTDQVLTTATYLWLYEVARDAIALAIEEHDDGHTCWIDDTTCADCGGVA